MLGQQAGHGLGEGTVLFSDGDRHNSIVPRLRAAGYQPDSGEARGDYAQVVETLNASDPHRR